MGTNYYVSTEPCGCCGHKAEPLHIGKSSSGWTFSFHSVGELNSWEEWYFYLVDKKIVDEYEREISLEDFTKLVIAKKLEPNNHAAYMEEVHPEDESSYLDKDGHSFTIGGFS